MFFFEPFLLNKLNITFLCLHIKFFLFTCRIKGRLIKRHSTFTFPTNALHDSIFKYTADKGRF